MKPVIEVERLGKKYVIGHNRVTGEQSFAESMMKFTRGAARRLLHPLAPNAEKVALEDFWALRELDFKVCQGDRVGIIGRNGSGKSTLLKLLSRITSPSEGRITIRGRVASLLEVGTGFHPELTGRENIFMNGAILGMSQQEIKRKFDEIVDFSGVEKFLDTPVKRYSSGMYVRLAFAVAAHLEPEILLIDEVLAVGDADFQKKCIGKMRDISRGDGRTIFFVSHNMAAVRSLCSKGIVLNRGRLEFESTDLEKCVAFYSGSSSANSFHWENDGALKNEYFTPVSMDLLAPDGSKLPDALYAEDEYRLRVVFDVVRKNSALYCDVLVSSAGVALFSASPQEQARSGVFEPGRHVMEFRLGPDLLNTQLYQLRLRAYLPNQEDLLKVKTLQRPPEIVLPLELRRNPVFRPTGHDGRLLHPQISCELKQLTQ